VSPPSDATLPGMSGATPGTTLLRPEREDLQVAALAALAVALHVLETALPSPVPGMKPGLANVVTVLALVRFGWRTAAWVGALRVLVGSLLLGTFLSPTFILSAAGATGALVVLGLAARLVGIAPRGRGAGQHDGPGRGLSPLGLSLAAALAHMGAQLGVAWLLFVPHPAFLYLAAPLMTAAAAFGTLSGIIAWRILELDATEPA